MNYGTLAVIITLIIACAFTGAEIRVGRQRLEGRIDAWNAERDALKKLGKWYEARVAELEQDSALLASQLVQAGTVPIHAAMPISRHEPSNEYASDPTGLVVEKLDPYDLPVS